MAETDNSVDTRHPDVQLFELLAEKDKSPDKSAFYIALWDFLVPKTGPERFEFLNQLRSCFMAQKRLRPNVDFPNF
jgi:hypothetical protein